jgi:hypothetical protein
MPFYRRQLTMTSRDCRVPSIVIPLFPPADCCGSSFPPYSFTQLSFYSLRCCSVNSRLSSFKVSCKVCQVNWWTSEEVYSYILTFFFSQNFFAPFSTQRQSNQIGVNVEDRKNIYPAYAALSLLNEYGESSGSSGTIFLF